MIRHLDLFSGIGGWSYAAGEIGGIDPIGFCEIDAWCRRVLDKHWPGVPKHDDIRTLTAAIVRGWAPGGIDLVTASYPCQGFSVAGKRGGEADDRFLWPEVARLVAELRPRFVVCENVAGHITLGLDRVLSDLESLGYACRAVVVPAGAVNALHRRDRVWILAHAKESGDGLQRSGLRAEPARSGAGESCAVGVGIDSDGAGREERRKQESAGTEQSAIECMGSGQPLADADGFDAGQHEYPRKTRDLSLAKDARRAETMAHTPSRGIRRGGPPGSEGLIALGGEAEAVPDADAIRRDARIHDTSARESESQGRGIGGQSGILDRSGGGSGSCAPETARSLGAQPHGLPFDVVRRSWADGSWERSIPRVVTAEPDRRRKLMAAGNAIVPQVAYEILRALIGGAA